MKKIISTLLLLALSSSAMAAQVGSAYQVLRMPSSGTIAKFGSVALDQSAAVTGTLPHGKGGTDVTSPGSVQSALLSDGTNWTSASLPTESNQIQNIGLSASVATNALTIALKQSDGSSDCSSAAPCKISIRSSTATTGGYNLRSATGSLSVVVPASTTLGTVSGATEYLYVYLIDNAGTLELATSVFLFSDTGSVVTTTAISGGTSRAIMYSTTARTGVGYRVIGRIKISEATAGTWATSPTEVSVSPFFSPQIAAWMGYHASISGGCATTSTTYADPSACTGIALTQQKNINFGTVTTAASSLPGITFTPSRPTVYKVCADVSMSSSGSAIEGGLRLVDGSGNILHPGVTQYNPVATANVAHTLCALYEATSTSAVTIKVQLGTNTGTILITQGTVSGAAAIHWTIQQLGF
jgi:hypothetical protein